MKNMVWNEEYGEWRSERHKNAKNNPSEYVEAFYCAPAHPERNYRSLGVFHRSKFNSLFPVGMFKKLALASTQTGFICSWNYYPLDGNEDIDEDSEHFYVISRTKKCYLESRAKLSLS